MKTTFEYEGAVALASCLVAMAGLLSLQTECSMAAISIVVIGLIGIMKGGKGIARAIGQRWASKRQAIVTVLGFN